MKVSYTKEQKRKERRKHINFQNVAFDLSYIVSSYGELQKMLVVGSHLLKILI